MKLEVIYPGGFTCLVDAGRYHFRKYGVPTSGVMDMHSAMRANSMVGNPVLSPLLEIFLSGFKVKALDTVHIGLSGAKADVSLNGVSVDTQSQITMSPGDTILVGKIFDGARLYIAAQGGFIANKALGSQSHLQGYLDTRVKKGDILAIDTDFKDASGQGIIGATLPDRQDHIQVTKGPEWHQLSSSDQHALLQRTYTVDTKADRMGYRLKGDEIALDCKLQIFSAPVMPGTIQLLHGGQLLALMRDCQTTGGYPRIWQITETSLSQLGQRKPGDQIAFELLT